jgi:hypothetical protein
VEEEAWRGREVLERCHGNSLAQRSVTLSPSARFRFTSEEAFHCSLIFDINYCRDDGKSSPRQKGSRRRLGKARGDVREMSFTSLRLPVFDSKANRKLLKTKEPSQRLNLRVYYAHGARLPPFGRRFNHEISISSQLNELFLLSRLPFTAHLSVALLTRTVSRHVLFKLKGLNRPESRRH